MEDVGILEYMVVTLLVGIVCSGVILVNLLNKEKNVKRFGNFQKNNYNIV